MTREEYESRVFTEKQIKHFHERTGKHPTKEEVIRTIREERRKCLFPARPFWSERMIQERSYTRFAALELIRRINESPEIDPIRIIYELWNFMDDLITSSERRSTWIFARDMMDAMEEVLDLLG